MERGFVSALAMNGAGAIHDFEIALSGATSEDVDEALGPGRFGMAEETGTELNLVMRRAAEASRASGRRSARISPSAVRRTRTAVSRPPRTGWVFR